MGSSRTGKRAGMTVAGLVLSTVVSVHQPDRGDADGQALAGRIAAEIMVTKSVDGIRDIVRVFLLLTAADGILEEGAR